MKKLIKQYKALYGNPDRIIETEPGNAKALQLLVHDAEPDDELMYTAVCSAGLSLLSKQHSIELRMEVNGKLTGKYIAELGPFFEALFGLIRKDKEIQAAKVYGPLTVPGFKGMKSVMIIDSGYMDMEMLDYDNGKGRVMTVLPLYTKEAKELEEMKPDFREQLVLKAQDELRNPKREESSVARMAMFNVWGRIADWYSENRLRKAADMKKMLKSGGKKNGEKLEKALGYKVLPDFRHSLDLISLGIDLKRFDGSTVASMLDFMKSINAMNKKGMFDVALHKLRGNPAIQQVWWHEKWIPFAMDSAGCHLLIDMAPGPDGEVGQVLLHDTIEGPLHTGFDSFLSWLDDYHGDLQSGRFQVEDGSLQEL